TTQVGKQVIESVRLRKKMTNQEARKESVHHLEQVRIPNPEERARQYPHEYSGGMRQRAMIAMALSCNPKLLIADEPTTALDVTIQAQIMDLLVELKNKTGTAIILITHDLGVVAGVADRVAVMYAGKIVETGSTRDIFFRHSHPYTEALLGSLPQTDTGKDQPLTSIPGTPPDLLNPPRGCGFAARCRHCMRICQEEQPPEFEVGEGHKASCWLLHPDCPGAAERGDVS
ncbi:MAG: ABC transporter ATP-binding protein, partial [Butyrivibrio sp.]|nr:ABC transporter ATP-binding protein [Butyrivibrio sp.]